jgi:hypothetical protein
MNSMKIITFKPTQNPTDENQLTNKSESDDENQLTNKPESTNKNQLTIKSESNNENHKPKIFQVTNDPDIDECTTDIW